MSSGAAAMDSDDAVEKKHLIDSYDNLEQGGAPAHLMSGVKKQEGFFRRLISVLDERCNVKMLMRKWKPYLEFAVRLMLIATFLDDSFHTAIAFSENTKQVAEQGCLRVFATTSPALVSIIATVGLGLGLLAQSLGLICLLVLSQPDAATKALICWVIAQPVLYGQISNFEFVSESLSLIGGLLMMRAHLLSEGTATASTRTQLLGRLMLPSMYVYYAGSFLFSALTLHETNNFAMYIASLSMFVINILVLFGFVVGSVLLAAGLKSRLVALLLALANIGVAFYQHPFFLFNYVDDNMPLPNVALPNDISSIDFDPSQIYAPHRYYFFLNLSTSGALLLLAQFGPGEIAIQKDEILLPVVARAQD